MGIMSWSDSGMAKRYQYLTAQVRRDDATRVGGLLWDVPAKAADDPDEAGSAAPVLTH